MERSNVAESTLLKMLLSGVALFPLLSGCGGMEDSDLDRQSQAAITGFAVAKPTVGAFIGPHALSISGTLAATNVTDVGCKPVIDGVGGAYTMGTVSGSTWTVTGFPAQPVGAVTLNCRLRTDSGTVTQYSAVDVVYESLLPTPTRVLRVTTLADLTNKIQTAVAGDYIVVAPGTYTTVAATDLKVTRSGTSAAPIVITSEYPGAATIAGPFGFSIDGSASAPVSYVTVRGFNLSHSDWNFSALSSNSGLALDHCKNCRVTRNAFALAETTATANWLPIYGETSAYNRIDHNSFKNKTRDGQFLLVYGSASNGPATYTTADHNYFFSSTVATGGGECARLGTSNLSLSAAYTTLEQNLFEQCNGDVEAVSIKTSNDTIRNNTFRNNNGSISLRHGNGSSVEGNFLLYGNQGIRVNGHDHKIFNNYLEGNSGTSGGRIPLTIYNGDADSDAATSNAIYSRATNVLITNNTFYLNTSTGNQWEIGALPASGGTLAPSNCRIANNILRADSGTKVKITNLGNTVFEGNVHYGTASNTGLPATGFTNVNPAMALVGGIYQLSSSSPMATVRDAEANAATYAFVALDVDGQTRSGTKDVGASEYSTSMCGGGVCSRRPLTTVDVGPLAQ